MQITQSRHKSYANVRWKDLEFDMGDMMFLKVAPMKSVLRFEKKGKLSPHFVGPFEIILEQIGLVVLRNYVANLSHVVDYKPLKIDENVNSVKQLVVILTREVKMLHQR